MLSYPVTTPNFSNSVKSVLKFLAVSIIGVKLAPEVTKAESVSLSILTNIKPGERVTDSLRNLAGMDVISVIRVTRDPSEIG